MEAPICYICKHRHWRNEPHKGSDWEARVGSGVFYALGDALQRAEVAAEAISTTISSEEFNKSVVKSLEALEQLPEFQEPSKQELEAIAVPLTEKEFSELPEKVRPTKLTSKFNRSAFKKAWWAAKKAKV